MNLLKRFSLRNRSNDPSVAGIYRVKGNMDYLFFALVLVIVAIGTIMVFSASYSYAREFEKGDSYFYARKQLIWAFAGAFVMLFVSFVDVNIVRKFSYTLFLVSLGLMIVVIFAPENIAPTVNGAKRWLVIPGLGQFQPSEVYKFAVILLLSDYICKKRDKIMSDDKHTSFVYGILPYIGVIAVSGIVMYFQPHNSGLIIIAGLVLVMMFIGETRWRYFGFAAILAAAGILVIAATFSHVRARFEVWFNPFDFMDGKGWQPAQALYAISAGGLFGVGLGNSNQKQLYIPEPQNDYIFPVFCEEFGFVGAVAVIILYVVLIYRGITIAMKAVDRFSRLLALGVILQIAIQAILNLFVVTNMLPSTGISLPFFSYGGSSMLVLMAEMGVILSISRDSLVDKRQPSQLRMQGAIKRASSERTQARVQPAQSNAPQQVKRNTNQKSVKQQGNAQNGASRINGQNISDRKTNLH